MTILPTIKIKGLLWQAEAQAIRLAGPLTEPNDDNWMLRNLWVEKRKDNSRYAPGTLIALCWIKTIKIEPISGKSYEWKRSSSEKPPEKPNLKEIESQLKSGNLALLLLQADSQSSDWKSNQIPECTCIAGDIYLIDALQSQINSRNRLYNALGISIKKDSANNNKPVDPTTRSGSSQLLAPIAVHSSGLTIFGEVKLSWLETKLTAPFQLSPLIENGLPISKFRLRLEEERLIPVNEQGVISEEVKAWIKAWQTLSLIVDPLSKLSEINKNDLKKYSTWVTLQVNNPNIVPPLYWQIDDWPKSDDTLQSYPVSFTQNAFRLVLTDQSLYNSDIVSSSLAQVAPLVTIQSETIQSEQDTLNIKIVATKQDQETKEIANEKLFYTGKQIPDPENQIIIKWQESINLSNLITTFSPTQVPQILREYQEIPIPEWFPLLENDPSEVGSVAAWQNILYGCGYTSEPRITGEMDLETVKLTKKFQKDLGLNQTDKVTLETWQAGLDILKNDPSKVGSVAAWQNILYRCGFTPEIRITGVMDLETIDLTKKFQQDLGLNQTGEVTLETWQAGLKHKKIFNWFHWISSKKTIEPALIWGFMPLEDGWAQLPFINLTEQVYLDANITSLNGSNFQATAQKVLPLLQGAVSFGNDRESVRKQEQVIGENAWSVTLVDGTNLVGQWKLQKKQNKEYELTDIELTIEKPDVNIQGLLWLSTGKPRSQDALPDLSNWVSGLRSIPLRTLQLERETFPPLIELLIEKLSFTPRNFSEEKNNQLIPAASLGQWQFRYQLRQEIYKQMTNKGILPTNIFSRFLPIIWRRHPHLPMIQALPMTQTQSPPNYPAASRQLVPYELPVNSEGIPDFWDFGITEEKGALNWSKYLNPEMLKPAQEWVQQLDLSLVSLSLPGLVLSPHNQFPHLKLEPKTQLYLQYRFDLPYTDEINALAQLPKVLPKPEEISPLPDSPQPQPAKTLTRETFKDYWQQLSERASLASGDAIFGLAQSDDKTFLKNLIEPLVWEINATFDLDNYPGRLELSNADNQAKLLSLEGDKALEGISGQFIELNGKITLNGGSNNSYNITAGSMAARLENDQIRDQRGLSRGVSKVDEKKSGKLLTTAVLFESQSYNLTTTLEALSLQIDEKETWRLWFRDVPFQNNLFNRLTTLSHLAEDINDPEAQSLDFNYRSGYEWRLNGSATSTLPLKLFGLDFYPLRLAKMNIIDQQIDTIEIIGRLQLPLQGIGEIETLSNSVNLQLKWKQELKKYVSNSLSLASFSSPVSLIDSLGEWVLNADKNSNTNLRLEWKKIQLNADKTSIELSQLTLQFYLFNTNWIVPLSGKSLSFPNTTVVEHSIPQTDDFSLTKVVLDFSQLFSPNVSLDFSVKFGDRFGEIPPQNRRITNGLQVLYTFTEGTGDTVLDRTQTTNPLNLKIKNTDLGTIDWLSGGGLRIKKSNIIKSITKATKLITACKQTNEISIEVWIKPQQEIQKAARIVTLSEDRNNRNFTLTQGIFEFQSKEYNVRLRHTKADDPDDGLPALQTRSDAIITDQPSHLIYTRKKGQVKIYLNGQELSPQNFIASDGDFSNWDENYFFALGNEMTEDRAWLGEYYLVAVYNRSLTLEEVRQNFSVGHLLPEISNNSEKAIAFQGNFQYDLIKQSITSFSGRLLDDLNIVINQEDNLKNILVNQSLQVHWQQCTAKNTPYLLPGILLNPLQISGYAALTFTIETKNNTMPLLKINSATVEALMVTNWGEFLQDQSLESTQAIFGSSAGNLAIGYLGELTTPEKFDNLERTWQESLLFNGIIELKNLISWPQGMTINNTEITLPSASVNPAINLLSHYRHSLKILFNQHQILPEQLTVEPGQNLLFTLNKDKNWQFLAVVEHQLIIVNPNEDLTQIRSTHEHRWTAVQNISITTPEQFRTSLENLGTVSIENPALAGTPNPLPINFGYLRSDLRTSLVKEVKKLSSHILLVEATTPFWIRKTPLKEVPQPISLQILPNGTQQAILSRPQDYYPTAPTDPQWLLFIMPFLGRLQPSSEDQLESQSMTKTHLDTLNALQVDPILLLHYWRKLSSSQAIPALKLALALSHWTNLGELHLNLSGFDLMLNRLWSRLDPLALEESWFRLQNPPPEAKPTFLQSILSAFPDTSARLSRDTALKRLFSFVRTFYPPQVSSNLSLDDIALIQQSEEVPLLLLQGVIIEPPANSIPYGWLLSGILLVQAFKGGAASSLNRHPVATLLSTRFQGSNKANPFPQSLTVSPYLGLQLQSLAENPSTELRLVVAELLCLNSNAQVLRPVASYTWESQKFSTNLDFQDILNNPADNNMLKLREKFRRNNIILSEKDVSIQVSRLANGEWEIVDKETQFTCRVRVGEQDKQLIFYQDRLTIGQLAKSWALQTQERLYPESPFAILRFREIDQVIPEKPTTIIPLVVRYAFELVKIEPSPLVVQRTFRLRSSLRQLRFREGQFNPALIPSLENLKPFEVAPPQTAGVQPIYRLLDSHGSGEWGLSALRVSVHYTEGQQAIADAMINGSDSQHQTTLWWQGCQHTVQFRSAKMEGERKTFAGLPPLFRSPAIKGFLPTISDLPLPEIPLEPQDQLQSILPGSLSYLLVGNRPGVMFALRHQLLRQTLEKPSEILVSGSIPVQHRMPRPVPLPDNLEITKQQSQERALQTWASYFEPQKRLIAKTSPIDEAFYAQCGEFPARRLQMKLTFPEYGTILANWDGLLRFNINTSPDTFDSVQWDVNVILINGEQIFEYEKQPESIASEWQFKPLQNDKNKSILNLILSESLGYSVTLQVSIKPKTEDKSFQQSLSFPLRVAGQFALPLAIEPYFIHYEDPEYNRRLASASAHSSRPIKLKKTANNSENNVQLFNLKLSADRRDYNSDNPLFFRFDWEVQDQDLQEILKKTTATLKFIKISKNQEIELEHPQKFQDFSTSKLYTFLLNQFLDKNNSNPMVLQAGDKLKIVVIMLNLGETGYNLQKEELDENPSVLKNPIVLIVNIIATPVNPVPQASYALLRSNKSDIPDSPKEVECVRFAWNPEPERIELVCAEDLTQEVVRRRAVFHWQDSARIRKFKPIYQIQKIAETGSTHFPLL